MRTFEYCCPRCQRITEHHIPGTEPPPTTVVAAHAGCPETHLKRVWMKVDINLGYRPERHDSVDQWMFANG